MDYLLFSWINGFVGYSPFLDAFGIFCAHYLIFVFPLGLLALSARLRALLNVGLSASLAFSLNAFVGFLYFRPRPYVTHDVEQLLFSLAEGKSFPSDHSALAWSMAVTLFMYDRRIGLLACGAAFLVSLARVFVGVHYPSDVLVGGIFGAVCAYFATTLFRKNCPIK